MEFSVCMSVYHGDNAIYFRQSLESIYNQTLPPKEVVLVVDGPVGCDIDRVINDYRHLSIPFREIRLEHNSGHAIARQKGLDTAHYKYVAIMDSDDIATHDRFEKQISFINQHLDVDVIGGQIEEFIDDSNNVVGKRIVPLNDEDIKRYLRDRCPMNLVTVMFKKESVQKVGGYIDWYCEEDYYLWIRMFLNGMRFANLPDTLVKVRVGRDMYARRGGLRYFRSEARLQYYMYKKGIIGGGCFLTNIVKRLIVQVMLPNWIRGWVFRTFARKK